MRPNSFFSDVGTPFAHTNTKPEKINYPKGGQTMKKQYTNKILVIISVVAMVGFAATAFAGWGRFVDDVFQKDEAVADVAEAFGCLRLADADHVHPLFADPVGERGEVAV